MENNTPTSKLDETIKEQLSNYDAKYDSGDWARMERMLDATPKSIAPSGSYNMALIIGGIVLVGGFAIYKVISSSKSTPEINTETVAPPVENKVEATPQPTPVQPTIVKTETPSPAVVETPAITPAVKTTSPELKTTVANTDTKTKVAAEKVKKDKKNKANEDEYSKNQKVTVMGNEPIFGDMIDSSKGIVRETKEKESTKKAAVTKGTTSGIGLSGLMNLNADSIRKQKEQMKKDTLQK